MGSHEGVHGGDGCPEIRCTWVGQVEGMAALGVGKIETVNVSDSRTVVGTVGVVGRGTPRHC